MVGAMVEEPAPKGSHTIQWLESLWSSLMETIFSLHAAMCNTGGGGAVRRRGAQGTWTGRREAEGGGSVCAGRAEGQEGAGETEEGCREQLRGLAAAGTVP